MSEEKRAVGLKVSLLGESLLFPSWGAGSLLWLRRCDCRAPTLLYFMGPGADLKCVGVLEGDMKGGKQEVICLQIKIINFFPLSSLPFFLSQSPCPFKIEQSLLADRA